MQGRGEIYHYFQIIASYTKHKNKENHNRVTKQPKELEYEIIKLENQQHPYKPGGERI